MVTPTLSLHPFGSPAAFAELAEPFLLRNEAAHNLILGILGDLLRTPPAQSAAGDPPYLATVDAGGRTVALAVRTPPHDLVLSAIDQPHTDAAVKLLAEDVRERYPTLSGVQGPAPVSGRFVAAWLRSTSQPARKDLAMRIYQLDAVASPPFDVRGSFRWATQADRDLVVAWVQAFRGSIGEPGDLAAAARIADRHLREREPDAQRDPTGMCLWLDGGPVSLSAFGGRTPHGVRIYAVYTPPELRRRGYASALVAALSQRMLDAGCRYCFLYTDLANPTSNHIYQQIGYRPVRDVDQYKFEPKAGEG